MARSEEAILRRAIKRSRTEKDQRRADRRDMAKAIQRQRVNNGKGSFIRQELTSTLDSSRRTSSYEDRSLSKETQGGGEESITKQGPRDR